MISNPQVQWSTAVHEADWIAARLAPFDQGTVRSVIPEGFEAYTRLLHPVQKGEDPVRWSQVAAWSQTPVTNDVQFHDIALPPHRPAAPVPWDSSGPAEGTLDASEAAHLVSVLRNHTTTPEHCWFALWNGYGWDGAARFELIGEGEPAHQLEPPIDPVPSEVRDGPLVELPERTYLLFTGPVEAALSFIQEYQQTPNLWWPADRSWCVASEIDLAWTYLSGSASLVDQVLADPALEALPAKPQDRATLRFTGWLDDAVKAAATELLELGHTQIRTAHRTLHASLQRPRLWRNGQLGITSHTDGGSSTAGSQVLFWKSGRATHQELWRNLSLAVAELATL
ncbi:hypothetical protein [Enteractinococcus helveticum]|uniref:Uncharacterized protein n=1 Tax=Enteractinococcus helveticum TaxID=1837282 RepID=A0A1B7M276_9MICC|nr:hypothetical protein [Enteractinococcus helveticum]OAV62702.1 hypothetical protein A6F49_04970 [Enteractinococcus helveticum]